MYQRLDVTNGGQIADMGVSQPTYDLCRNTSAYSYSSVTLTETEPGQVYCFLTGDNRYASGVVQSFDKEQLVMHMVVWEK